MTIRSTTSSYQPSPPNYRLASTGVFRNVGRYHSVTSASTHRIAANMCTAPTTSNHAQFQYIPRVSG